MKYIIDTKLEKQWQQTLNQWKHNYKVDIIKAIPRGDRRLTLILTRKEK